MHARRRIHMVCACLIISVLGPAWAQAASVRVEEPEILTPPAPPQPRIHGPQVYGVRAGSPFLYRIPCTGQRPMEFAAEGLPEGLTLDPHTGIITGNTRSEGKHRATLIARNAARCGEARVPNRRG